MVKAFSSLFIIQLLNYFIPFIILPLISRFYGPELFGAYSLALVFGSYIGLVTEFGYERAGINLFSSSSSGSQNLIYSRIQFTRVTLGAASIIIGLLFFNWLITDVNLAYLVVASFSFYFQGLYPNWVHQFNDNYNSLLISNFISRAIFLTLALGCIYFSLDIFFVLLSLAISNLICLFISHHQTSFSFLNKKLKPDFKELFHRIPYFLITILPHGYTSLVIIFFINKLSPLEVGIIYAADRIYNLVKRINSPLQTAAYPYFVKRFSNNYNEGLSKLNLFFFLFFLLLSLFCFLLFLFGESIIGIIYGEGYDESVKLFEVLIIIPPFTVLSNYIATQKLLANNKVYYLIVSMLAAGLIVQAFAFAIYQTEFDLIDIAYLILLGEILVGFFWAISYLYVKKYEK